MEDDEIFVTPESKEELTNGREEGDVAWLSQT